jgi:large subunit ribosomal protein L3
MTLALIGTKLGMTHVFTDDGSMIPVTVLQLGPCPILQLKTAERDGYTALQLGYGLARQSAVNRAQAAHDERARAHTENRKPRITAPKQVLVTQAELGHANRAGVPVPAVVREARVDDISPYTVGQTLTCDIFAPGELVDVIGTSKGRGFASPMKRHHSSRGPETHGSNYHRRPGSGGASADPSRVRKGKKNAGHMGDARTTVLNLQVVQADPAKNILLVRGAVPGFNGALVLVRKSIHAATRGGRKYQKRDVPQAPSPVKQKAA